MKTISLFAAFLALSDAAPQSPNTKSVLGGVLSRAQWPYFPAPVPTPDNEPAPAASSSSPFRKLVVAVTPAVKSSQVVGLVSDPTLNRDSCNSAAFGNRTLWTCRDTQVFGANGAIRTDVFLTTTASWSNTNTAGIASLTGLKTTDNPYSTTTLKEYGTNSYSQSFFPVNAQKYCSSPSGGCSDGTRYVLWHDSPPMKTSDSVGYTWIRQTRITNNLQVAGPVNPATILYKTTYTNPTTSSAMNNLPQVSVVQDSFWAKDQIPFGVYGNVVRNGIAYLYGQANGTTALAKVPVGQVENKSAYQYWVNGTWTSTMPKIGQDGIRIENANVGGQGTYYFSQVWNSYVWIGGSQFPGSDMYITTAPDPTGPWIAPFRFYSGVNGNAFLGAYSIQAHPALTQATPNTNAIYVSYTKLDTDPKGSGNTVYTTPLIYIQWQ